MLESIIGFIACSSVIIFSGKRLAIYGDKIGEILGLSKVWLGFIMMASITSLPELITGISSVTIVNSPDLAAGDIFGSCMFNILILAMLDIIVKKPLTSMVKSGHVLAGICSIILVSIAGLGIFIRDIPDFFGISPITILIIAVYLISVRLIFLFEKKSTAEIQKSESAKTEHEQITLQLVVFLYVINALIVIAGALFLPFFGEIIAEHSGLGSTFFGTFFIAMSTSLPELVVSVSAVRIGSVDIAVGNLIGSNVFNILILAIDDIFYLQGSLFNAISDINIITIFFIIIASGTVIIGLILKFEKKRFPLADDTFAIVIIYITMLATLFYYHK